MSMQLSQGAKDVVTELGQRVKIVSDRMASLGDALNERASYDDVARSIIQVQTVFESLSDRVAELVTRVADQFRGQIKGLQVLHGQADYS